MAEKIDLLEPFRRQAKRRGSLVVSVRGDATIDLSSTPFEDMAAYLAAEARKEWETSTLKDKQGGKLGHETGKTMRSIRVSRTKRGARIRVSLPAKRVAWFPRIKELAPSLFAHSPPVLRQALERGALRVTGKATGPVQDKLGDVMRSLRSELARTGAALGDIGDAAERGGQ